MIIKNTVTNHIREYRGKKLDLKYCTVVYSCRILKHRKLNCGPNSPVLLKFSQVINFVSSLLSTSSPMVHTRINEYGKCYVIGDPSIL